MLPRNTYHYSIIDGHDSKLSRSSRSNVKKIAWFAMIACVLFMIGVGGYFAASRTASLSRRQPHTLDRELPPHGDGSTFRWEKSTALLTERWKPKSKLSLTRSATTGAFPKRLPTTRTGRGAPCSQKKEDSSSIPPSRPPGLLSQCSISSTA